MATNLDVITRALRIANVIREGETPPAATSEEGLEALNDMMADWEATGIELGYYPQTSLAATIPVEDKDLRGIKYNLAREIASSLATLLTPEATRIAVNTKNRLAKGTREFFENSFEHLPKTRRSYDVNTQ